MAGPCVFLVLREPIPQTDHKAQNQRSQSHLNRLPLKGWTTASASSRQTQTILLRRFHSLGTEVLKAGGSQHEHRDGKGNGHDGQGCKPTAKG